MIEKIQIVTPVYNEEKNMYSTIKNFFIEYENSDFEITSDLNIDNSNEGVITGGADFQLSGSFSASDGSLTSTGGEISLLEGGQLSSSGKLDVTDSTWILSGDFSKSGGTLTISETDFQLESSSTLTSDESLSFVTLNLNDYILILQPTSPLRKSITFTKFELSAWYVPTFTPVTTISRTPSLTSMLASSLIFDNSLYLERPLAKGMIQNEHMKSHPS